MRAVQCTVKQMMENSLTLASKCLSRLDHFLESCCRKRWSLLPIGDLRRYDVIASPLQGHNGNPRCPTQRRSTSTVQKEVRFDAK